MKDEHLYILHLFPNTENEKVNEVAQIRHDNLIKELESQNITQYTLVPGTYNSSNTKKEISKGHHKIVQNAKDLGLSMCLIAEDDLQFTSPNSWKYFLSQIPESFDLFFGLIYAGNIEDNRVVQGFSGGMTLYAISSRFYDTFLEQPIDTHVDRNLGNFCHLHEFKVIPEYCVIQRGGMSHQLKRHMVYDDYLVDKKIYKAETH